ncbi:carbohydrate ABC transporter permease [Williamsoniiplasma lucivorax]|uniref:sn-glycerol-3-phosphate ABC transporter permease n=1 Tax=Williamsoniiplasma lucivorax TaxID=209274 RepID=A0A2S5REG4_9MOLU|nr:sugar ABC transporter permease [Williamsoniiplasma lucivorax]PPE05525.1 sn-glycerol-3-phosphate ABC transporter permease [Williamsoniiplasma lucivorax]
MNNLNNRKKQNFNLKFANLNQKWATKNHRSPKRFDKFYTQAIWVIPGMLFITIFIFIALFFVIQNAVNGATNQSEFQFTFWNFKVIFSDQTFTKALSNTFLFALIAIPIGLVLSVAIARCLSMLLNQRFFSFMQGLFFLPYVTSTLAISLSFAVMFSGAKTGIMNSIISLFGADPVAWLANPKTAFAVVIFNGIWIMLPFQIIMLTTGFMRIDRQYYAAASIDGMSKLRQFWKITLPQLTPTLMYLITMIFIWSFQYVPMGLFENETKAEAVNAQTIVFWIYERITGQGSKIISYSKAGAASLILMFIILIITIINRVISNKLWKKFS